MSKKQPPEMTDEEKQLAAEAAAGAAEKAPGVPEEPERFKSGGATAEEIAAWRAQHAG